MREHNQPAHRTFVRMHHRVLRQAELARARRPIQSRNRLPGCHFDKPEANTIYQQTLPARTPNSRGTYCLVASVAFRLLVAIGRARAAQPVGQAPGEQAESLAALALDGLPPAEVPCRATVLWPLIQGR